MCSNNLKEIHDIDDGARLINLLLTSVIYKCVWRACFEPQNPVDLKNKFKFVKFYGLFMNLLNLQNLEYGLMNKKYYKMHL